MAQTAIRRKLDGPLTVQRVGSKLTVVDKHGHEIFEADTGSANNTEDALRVVKLANCGLGHHTWDNWNQEQYAGEWAMPRKVCLVCEKTEFLH